MLCFQDSRTLRGRIGSDATSFYREPINIHYVPSKRQPAPLPHHPLKRNFSASLHFISLTFLFSYAPWCLSWTTLNIKKKISLRTFEIHWIHSIASFAIITKIYLWISGHLRYGKPKCWKTQDLAISAVGQEFFFTNILAWKAIKNVTRNLI